MKEIIYIQAGELANYTGTHFWNTQESYLNQEGPEIAEFYIDPDISFTKSLTPTGYDTLCPRLLIFDEKANFGTLASNNAAFVESDEISDEQDDLSTWNGDVVEYRQDLISTSSYQTHMEDPSDDLLQPKEPNNSTPKEHQDVGDIRYWSDYSRVFYVPRTIHKLPDATGWDSSPNIAWNKGHDSFQRYNQEADVMETSLRLFVEECDSLQGLQIINDSDKFGGFMSSFLTNFRDEFHKTSTLVFPLLSDSTYNYHQGARKVINDALYLRSLNELSTMAIPVQPVSHWPENIWRGLDVTKKTLYHQSAILSAHVESATLPFRLKKTTDHLSHVCRKLNWPGTIPFGGLSGILPVTSLMDIGNNLINFSIQPQKETHYFARLDVTRGFSSSQTATYMNWCASSTNLQAEYVSSVHCPAYPLPTSFPRIFGQSDWIGRSADISNPTKSLLPTVGVFSSIATSREMSHLFRDTAKVVEQIERLRSVAAGTGLDSDELKELSNDLWKIHDGLTGDGEDFSEVDTDREAEED